MASTCITRDARDTYGYLCGSEDVKPTMVLAVGEPTPSKLTEFGAPLVCPECVVLHAVSGITTSDAKRAALESLFLAVGRSVLGTTQGRSTIKRYEDAAREAFGAQTAPACIATSHARAR